ncbi:hypothetical protein [Urbifossiella limnaea]|uniref:Uncharacterized protein n=1 Tax=Urbifossiella limnaea TaxID=2528023 RepID=A0A517XWG9_9BACT|nr:hypothetical protein [Urbifossiella limnaea]QDU21814.1 hypothetical protein ETAA1_37870 [Urbifossiella limnaea]
MDRIEWAERSYRQIVPAPDAGWAEVPVRRLEVWLRDAVAPLVAEYVRRTRFQDLAAWPLRALRPGSGSPARAALEAVDESLVGCAKTVQTALRSTRVRRALEHGVLPEPVVTSQTSLVGGDGTHPLLRQTERIHPLPVMEAQVEGVARRFWADLVNPEDYWRPSPRWLLAEGLQTVSSGELVASLNPELHRVGDFITRCLERRVTLLVEELRGAGHAILAASRPLGPRAPKATALIPSTLAQLEARVRALYASCWPEPEGAYRDSCVTLVQAYVAYHPDPHVEWLGDASAESALGGHVFRHNVSHARKLEVTDRVAAALADLRRMYAEEPPGQSALDEAVASGGLVVAEALPQAFWSGKPLTVAWHRHPMPWKLLLLLARKARFHTHVVELDVYEDDVSESAMATLLGRLKKLLPPELRKAIVPGPEPRSYRLDLPPRLVHLVDVSDPHSRRQFP